MIKLSILHAIVFLAISFSVRSQTQAEMNRTAYEDYKIVDEELNKVYKDLIAMLNDKERLLLKKAQRNWIKFRDTHCEFASEQFDGGSIQPLIYSSCLKETTDSRIFELKAEIKSRTW